jgi:two-component system, NarL family, invasion response regulator UvrY
MMNILIADDHPLIRKGLRQILSGGMAITHIFEAENGREAMEILARTPINVLILDISMPDKDGIEVLKDVKLLYPDLPVLMLSIQPETQYALRALRFGASGCLNKASAPEELIDAIIKVQRGGQFISEEVSELLLKNLQVKNQDAPHRELSEREYQVMIMLASGDSLSDIADRLSLSIKTVSTYRARLLAKMNMTNNSQLTYYAMVNDLIKQVPR